MRYVEAFNCLEERKKIASPETYWSNFTYSLRTIYAINSPKMFFLLKAFPCPPVFFKKLSTWMSKPPYRPLSRRNSYRKLSLRELIENWSQESDFPQNVIHEWEKNLIIECSSPFLYLASMSNLRVDRPLINCQILNGEKPISRCINLLLSWGKKSGSKIPRVLSSIVKAKRNNRKSKKCECLQNSLIYVTIFVLHLILFYYIMYIVLTIFFLL